MERRELIQWVVATAALPRLSLGSGLSAHVERTLAVATERIVPGAAEANVGAFIDKMLADWHTPEARERFLAGQRVSSCRARTGRDFIACGATDQDAVLTALDAEVTALRVGSGGSAAANEHWFAMLKYLTVYGWCTSEPGMRALGLYPMAGRYDGCAPL